MPLFFLILLTALSLTGFYLVGDSFGFTTWYAKKRRAWMPCIEFCTFFWLSLAFYSFMLPFTWLIAIYALVTAVIARKMV